MNWRYLLPLALVMVVGAFLVLGLSRDPALLPTVFQDRPVPQFDLPGLRDPQQRLSSADLVGEVSLVNAWGSWCVTCLQEHPLLIELAKQQQLPIYGLNFRDETTDAQAWLQRFGNPYTMNVSDYSGRTSIDFGVYAAPESFLVDEKGIIVFKQLGALTPEVIENEILPRIAKQGSGAR